MSGAAWVLAGPEAYRWYLIREDPLPLWAKQFRYWLITAVMIAFGPVLVLMYEASGATLTPIPGVQHRRVSPVTDLRRRPRGQARPGQLKGSGNA